MSEALPTFEQARHTVEQHAAGISSADKELVGLLDGAGRILAESLVADRNFPPFPRAARDGYAVRAADLISPPAVLDVVGEIKAGAAPDSIPEVGSGQAAVIMTGAPAPAGADAVVMVEFTSLEGKKVRIEKGIEPGVNIVPVGSEAKRGEQLLSPGAVLDPAAIAIAASVGRSRILVFEKPRVSVLATGDEIVDTDVVPGPYQIRNSNSYSLAAQILAAGGEPMVLPVAPDQPARLRELILDGLDADLLLLAGGVSMGKYDYVEQVLAELGAEFFFTGAQIQPGKPIVFGKVQGKYFFGLPGNPVSTMVTFELFVRPMLEALSGRRPRQLIFLQAKLKTPIRTKTGLTRFLPAVISGEFEKAEVELARWQGSGDITSTARANCYVVIPSDRAQIEAGEWVPVLLR